MAKFFVGQRVRIKYSIGWPELAGTEGRIVPPPTEMPAFENPHGREWACAPDAWGGVPYQSPMPGFNWFAPNEDQLEPILPEGHQPSEFTTLHDLLASLEVTA